MKIDTSQINAIRHKDGPELVLAGPGSGKTLVITRRVQHLIEQYHIPPSSILVITFTKAAATEMRQRFEKLMGGRRVSVSFGTFHAVYFMILKHAYGYTADNIVKEEQRLQFMKEYIHRLRLEYDDENEFISSLFSEISLVKNTSVNLAHYYSSCCGQDVFRKIFEAYESFLHQNRLIDFDDMLVYCKELLVQRPDILAAWQRKYQYILIDEFQDINQIQYDIIRMLAAPQDNLFIVGDDDQSIYRFRGAKPEIMLNFTKDYPNAGKIILDTNYRSGAEIVKQAGNLISFNEKRFEKQIYTGSRNGDSGGKTGISDTAGTKFVCDTGNFASAPGRNGVQRYGSAVPYQYAATLSDGNDAGLQYSVYGKRQDPEYLRSLDHAGFVCVHRHCQR